MLDFFSTGRTVMPKQIFPAHEQPIIAHYVRLYLKSLSPREQYKLCRAILLRLDTSRMTLH
jgi:hypothetical protein